MFKVLWAATPTHPIHYRRPWPLTPEPGNNLFGGAFVSRQQTCSHFINMTDNIEVEGFHMKVIWKAKVIWRSIHATYIAQHLSDMPDIDPGSVGPDLDLTGCVWVCLQTRAQPTMPKHWPGGGGPVLTAELLCAGNTYHTHHMPPWLQRHHFSIIKWYC